MRRGENIYKRKDGRWEARYKKGYKPNGKIKYGYIYGRIYNEVRTKLYLMKAHYLNQQETYGETCISLEEWGHIWLKEVKQQVKSSTYSSYEYKINKYVFPQIGELSLNELTEATGEQLVNLWIKSGLEVSTMKVILRITNQCLNEAIQKEYLKQNPFLSLKLPKKTKKPIRALNRIEQEKLQKAALAEKNDAGLPTYLALQTGLRIGEIAALQWKDIDFDRHLITVNKTYQRIYLADKGEKTQLVTGSTKTESSTRTVPIGQKLQKILMKHRKQSKGEFVFSTKNHPMEPRLITYHFHRIRKQCGLENIHFHQLRHTFATRCIETKGDIRSVSELLGHSSTKLTLDTYADSMTEQRFEVIYRMEAAIC